MCCVSTQRWTPGELKNRIRGQNDVQTQQMKTLMKESTGYLKMDAWTHLHRHLLTDNLSTYTTSQHLNFCLFLTMCNYLLNEVLSDAVILVQISTNIKTASDQFKCSGSIRRLVAECLVWNLTHSRALVCVSS